MDIRFSPAEKKSHPHPHDAYSQQMLKLRKRWIIFPIISLLTLGGLSYFSSQHFLQPHGFIFILLSVTSGYWISSLSYLYAWISFLKPRLKNPSTNSFNEYPLSNARKNGRRALVNFFIASGFFVYSLIVFILQQIDDDPTDKLQLRDCIALIFFSTFIALAIFLITNFLIGTLFKINLFPRSASRNHIHDDHSFLFAENHVPYERRFGLDEHTNRSTHDIWAQWDNDPANPASPTYRPLHRDDY